MIEFANLSLWPTGPGPFRTGDRKGERLIRIAVVGASIRIRGR